MNTELVYNSINTAIKSYNCLGCRRCWTVSDSFYCVNCDNAKNNFGCVSLKKKSFCVLNKQYEEGEYKKLVERIITDMKTRGEWGEFMPPEFSPFGYNESAAAGHFPLTEAEVKAKGWPWQEKMPGTFGQETIKEVADDIKEVKDEITKEVLACQRCGKNYKFINQEFNFYQKQNLPLPLFCPDCRHSARISQRGPRHLWPRNCEKCNREVRSVYAPDRPERVYCEECYQKEIY